MKLKYLFFLVFFISAFLISNNVMADGNKLLNQCLQAEQFLIDKKQKGKNPVQIGLCLGFLQGVSNTMVVYQNFTENKKTCFPEGGIKNDQSLRIALKYLKNHPEQLHWPEGPLIVSAFMEAFPCE